MAQSPLYPRPPYEDLSREVVDLYRVADAMQKTEDSLASAVGSLLERIADLHAHDCPVCRANGGPGACPLTHPSNAVVHAYLLSLLGD